MDRESLFMSRETMGERKSDEVSSSANMEVEIGFQMAGFGEGSTAEPWTSFPGPGTVVENQLHSFSPPVGGANSDLSSPSCSE